MHAGDTFLISFDHTGPYPHLWILVTEPGRGEPIVLVSITTLRHGKDQTVVLQPGDHPWVRHPSCVFFADAMLAEAERLQEWIEDGLAIPEQPCSPELLSLVRDGLRSSEFTPRKVRKAIGLD